jgi:quercetin dioxygenase-like cupin family protein
VAAEISSWKAVAIYSFRGIARGAEIDTLEMSRREHNPEGVGPMYISTKYIITIGASAALWTLATPALAQQTVPGPTEIVIGDARWYPVPSILPQGAKVTFVSGNPYMPGEFTVEFRMPDKYTLPPHTNPAREHVMLKSGALRVGLGRKINRKKSLMLAAGDTTSTPAGVPHWSIAEGDVDLVVTYQTGPMGIAYMSRRDEPGSHSFPSGY